MESHTLPDRMPMRLQYSVLTLTALLLATAPRVRADNWSQFRHDRGRTGASQDPVRFPVMPLWQWSTRGRSNYTPLSHAAITAGVLHFVAADGASRVLLALDARSGRELWRQPLAAERLGHPLTDQVAPTAAGGRVLVYDWVSRSGEPNAPKFPVGGKPATGFLIRSFDAATGIEEVGAALTQLGARGALPRLNLPLDRLRPDLYSLVLFTAGPLPDVTNASARVPRLPELLGPPLVDGGTLFATSLSEMICRWTPGADPQLSRVHRPIPPPYALHSAAAFSGAPPVAAGPGWVITDGKQNHMVASLDHQGRTLWHRYLPFPIGVPAGDDRQVYLPLGNPDGTEAILVLDAADGAEKWLFSPQATSRRIVLSEPRPPVPPVNLGVGGGTPSAGRGVRQNFNIVDQRIGLVSQGQSGVFRFGGNGPSGAGPAPGVRGSPLGGGGFAGAGFGGGAGGGSPVSAGSGAGTPRIQAQGAPNRMVNPLNAFSTGQDNSTLRLWLNQQHTYQQVAQREALLAATQYHRFQKQALDMLVGETQVYPLHPGLVVSGGRVFGIVQGALWAIDTEIGRPLWQMPLPPRSRVHSLIASRGHLVLCVSEPPDAPGMTGGDGGRPTHWLVALHQETGQPVWETPVGQPGNLATADGLVYFMNGDLTVFAPAERTFAVASDSGVPGRYRTQAVGTGKQAAGPDGAERTINPAAAAGEMDDPPGGSGSAAPTGTQLRLTWGADVEALVVQVRARRLALPGVPLLLSLDWLSPDRSTRRGAGAWSAATEANFVLVCRQLAAEGRPEFFDLAPEVNVYLARHPDATPAVARMLANARAAIRSVSPGTRTMASWNVEVLLGRYGQGAEFPFGQIPISSQGADPSRFAEAVDAVGLSLRPGAAFRQPQQAPRDYLTAVKYRFPNHPLLITDLGFGTDTLKPDAEGLIRRALRSGYWLDAQWVCVPESLLDATRGAADAPDHPVVALRNELLALTQVEKLAAGQPPAP